MNRQPDINKQVNKALESLDGIQKAEPTPFFYTRLMARLELNEKSVWETTGALLARPAVAFASLFIILAVNAFILFEKDAATNEPSASYTSQNTEEEYVLTASNNTSYDYENIEP
jgi:hypothetical protein